MTYMLRLIEHGTIGFSSKSGTKGGEIHAALCPECGEISMYHPKEPKLNIISILRYLRNDVAMYASLYLTWEGFVLKKEFKIQGCVEFPFGLSEEDFRNTFISFIESNNWSLSRRINEIIDGF